MHRGRSCLALLALPMVLACVAGEHPDTSALEARVRAIEKRVTTDTAGGAGAETALTRRLDADVRSLEQRLSALEAEVRSLRAAPPGAGRRDADGAAARRDTRRAERADRRAALRALTAEYRDRLAEVRADFGDDASDPARQEALREVVDWYREERHELMRAGR